MTKCFNCGFEFHEETELFKGICGCLHCPKCATRLIAKCMVLGMPVKYDGNIVGKVIDAHLGE